MIAIRPAAADDARRLAELRWEFRAGKDAPVEDRGEFLERCAEWMSHELKDGRWRAWVAERDGEVVGQAWLQLLSKIPNPNGERARHEELRAGLRGPGRSAQDVDSLGALQRARGNARAG